MVLDTLHTYFWRILPEGSERFCGAGRDLASPALTLTLQDFDDIISPFRSTEGLDQPLLERIQRCQPFFSRFPSPIFLLVGRDVAPTI